MKKENLLKTFFESSDSLGRVWLNQLHGWDDPKKRISKWRAGLRRCENVGEVRFEASFYRLYEKWPENNGYSAKKDDVAIFALAVSELKSSSPFSSSLGKAMARSPKESDRATVSGLRFRKLLESEEDEFLRQLRRITRQIKDVDVYDLARICTSWNWDETRPDLAEEYYTNAKQEL